jgi:hypothetical protein
MSSIIVLTQCLLQVDRVVHRYVLHANIIGAYLDYQFMDVVACNHGLPTRKIPGMTKCPIIDLKLLDLISLPLQEFY